MRASDADALTVEEMATNFETMRHVERVRNLLNKAVVMILDRAEKHDQSKLLPPEVGLFTEWTPKLAAITYGSQEYEEFLRKLAPALAHHYARNRHHPEHFADGVNGMNLIDLLEMFVDWKAAGERHHDGNIRRSIEKNADRFSISPQLVRILENTAELFD